VITEIRNLEVVISTHCDECWNKKLTIEWFMT
jgi:hypothetical protein